MDLILAVAAAVIASWFCVELWRSSRASERLHTEIWTAAFAAYALATWALVAGLGLGWTSLSFRTFYFFGAVANIPLLAAGSIALASERAGRVALKITVLWIVFGFFSVFLAPFAGLLPADSIPEGSDVFGFTFMIDAMSLPGPRMFAAISGAVGTIVVVGLALASAVRSWASNRRRAYGNLLIVAGTLAPAFGGSLTALGESVALSVSLAVGIVLLYSGYRLASSAGRSDVRDTEPTSSPSRPD
ncbi:MAG: hypothetical protein ACR2NG_08235 [Acidimicrobiia bacterium]